MGRKFRTRLRHNKKTTLPKHFVFWDVENHLINKGNDFIEMPLRLGVGIYSEYLGAGKFKLRGHILFRDGDHFADFIIRHAPNKGTLYVLAHNAQHDINTISLLHRLAKKGFNVNFMYLNGKTTIIRMRNGKKRIALLDSMNFIPGKLEAWGNKVKRFKIDVDFNNVSDYDLMRHCARDVTILQKVMGFYLKFIEDNDLGEFHMTLAGQALAAYRHRFMKERIDLHTNKKAIQLELDAYGGGMVRVLYHGDWDNGTVYATDVNSMYPYVMLKYQYPTKLLKYTEKATVDDLIRWITKFAVIADVTIRPDRDAYRMRVDNVIVYPAFPFRTVLTTPEIMELIKHGEIIKVHRVAVYRKRHIFKEYVNYFYNLKKIADKKGDMPMRQFAKLFLNSLYGKFGARESKFERDPNLEKLGIPLDFIVDHDTGKRRTIYWLEGMAFVEEKGGITDQAFPAIAAHVTAYARMHLDFLRRVAGEGHVLYMDTDSLFVDEVGYHNLSQFIDDHRLGYLKVEKTMQRGRVLARKWYEWPGKSAHKGIRGKPVEIEPNTYVREIWPSLRAMLRVRRGQPYGIHRQKVHMSFALYDGVPDENLWVHPFTDPGQLVKFGIVKKYKVDSDGYPLSEPNKI